MTIVSTDIERKKAQIWSRDETPDKSIATAVAASCAIPFFFTPVETVHVDGGLVSNRPDFVFIKKPHVYNSILSFKLKSKEQKGKGFTGFLNQVVATLIDGSDNIQHSLIPSVEEIEIPVNIGATEFHLINEEKIKELIRAGEESVRRELIEDTDKKFLSRIIRPKGVLKNRERTYTEVTLWSFVKSYKRIIVYESTLDWVWSLFPTLLSWIEKGSKVIVFSEDLDDDFIANIVNDLKDDKGWTKKQMEEEKARMIRERKQRESTLKNLGCLVEKFRKNKTKGFFFIDKEYAAIAIQYTGTRISDRHIESKVYSDNIDSHMLKVQIEATEIIKKFDGLQPPSKINLKEIDFVSVETRLRMLQAYKNSEFSLIEVNIQDLLFLNLWLRGFEYNQIKHVFDLYEKKKIPLFKPAKIIYPNGNESYMSPIVIERHQDKLYVIKGNVRCLYAYKHGFEKLYAVVVDNVDWELPIQDPDTTYKIDQLFVREVESSGESRYKGFDRAKFRYIEQAIREETDNED